MIYTVLENKALTNDIFSMTLKAPDIASSCQPGQFLNILVPYDNSKLLRRPISICDSTDSSVTIVYQIKGEGTKLISKVKSDSGVDVIGPLGKGFPLVSNKKTAIVGGGIGVFPLLFLKKKLSCASEVDCFLGYRNKECIVLKDEFSQDSKNMCIATDDGSFDNCGYITEFFEPNPGSYDVVYSCGPIQMLKTLKKICEDKGILLYMSIEERMGCGIGACLVCACRVKIPGSDSYDYKLVCKDGPVFDSREVII